MAGNLRCERYRKRERTAQGAHARYYYSRSMVLDAPAHRQARVRPRCQSAPRVMDNRHSRSESPREPARPAHRPPSPPAFDNRAFQHDDPNHNDSFASRHTQNGDSKEHNGDTKTLEAVNLELINLQPKNGNTKKKDVEVDMNASNPYDEYFVPVNEHRKYMRGEKLYVTADKRGEKGGCRRPLCWALAGLLAAAVVALVALTAAGVLFSMSPTPVELYNASISSARALGGVGQGAGDLHHDHHHTHHMEPTTPGHQPMTLQTNEDSIMDFDETNDSSMYVPRTLEGELKIDNEEFTSGLVDPESDEYKLFTESLSRALKEALFNKNTVGSDDNEFFVEVVHLRNGSVIVTYRIHWKPKLNAAESTEIITASQIQRNLETYLLRSNRMISVHHVAEDKLTMRRVLDMCQINKNNCDHGCAFDEITLDFTCICPQGQMLDASNPHTCLSILESNLIYDIRQKESRVLNLELNTTTEKGGDEDKTESQHSPIDNNFFDWKETNHVTPETTTEADNELKFSHIFGHQRNDERTEKPELKAGNDKPKSAIGVRPDMELEPFSEPEPTYEPDPTSDSEPSAEPELTLKPKPSLKSQPVSELPLEPAQSSELDLSPNLESTMKPGSTSEPEPSSEFKPTSEPASKSEPEPSSEPEPASEPEPGSELVPTLELVDPASEPEPTSTPEPTSKPTSKSQENSRSKPVTESMYHQLTTLEDESTDDSKLTLEPISDANETLTSELRSPQSKNETLYGRDLMTQYNLEIDQASVPEANPESEPNSETETPTEQKSENIIRNSKSGQINFFLMMTTDSSQEEAITGKTSQEESFKPHTENINQTNDSEGTSMPELVEFKTNGSLVLKPNSVDSANSTLVSLVVSSIDDEIGVTPGNTTNNETVDATTSRVSISQVHIINEPSYEANPEIVSILRQSNKPFNDTNKTDSIIDENTYTDKYWLENDMNVKALDNDKYGDNVLGHLTNPFTDMFDGPIEKQFINKTEYDLTFSTTDKSETDSINVTDEETLTTITSPFSKKMQTSTPLPTYIHHLNDENLSVTSLNNSMDNLDNHVTKTISTKYDSLDNFFEKSIDVNSTRIYDYGATTEKEASNEYTLQKNIDSSDEKHLIKALSNNNTKEIMTTTEETNLYNVDITFDSINMLFNRSSKSFYRQNNTDNSITENTFYKEPTTTDSDWLSEPVTETNYQEIINKMENSKSTESSVNKNDDIINHGTTKDDFEPDYLVNIGSSNNKHTDQDIIMYGMMHDYDDEESRVKRVNTESKTNASTVVATEKAKDTIETTTTVGEYLDNSAEENLTGVSNQSKENSSLFLLDSAEPAPFWEISDSDNHNKQSEQPQILDNNLQRVENTNNHSKSASQNTTPPNFNVTIYEISSNRNHTIPVSKHVNTQSTEYYDHNTEMNPFLPEIDNNKSLVKKLQEGHDLEPTNLNETQNENIEDHSSTTELKQNVQNLTTSIKLTDTSGNDAVSDDFIMNAFNSRDSQRLTLDVGNKTFNGTFTYSDRHKSIKDIKDIKEKDFLPISTFLIDTDDLDKEHTTEYNPEIVKNNSDSTKVLEKTTENAQAIIDESDEYLSVVSIDQDQDKDIPKKHFKSDHILEVNELSDSPKKSARRTIDLTK